MRYAIFSDIHGNRPAWNAVLADMKALEADVYVCLGDIVGYGPCPQEVLDAIRAETSNFVIGNHDAAAAGVLDASIFNDEARKVIEWTRDHLNQEAIEFLTEMPLAIEDEDLLFVHAEIEEPGRFLYIESEEEAQENFQAGDQQLTFVGHTHNPGIFVQEPDGSVCRLPDQDGGLSPDRRYIINVGSVGEPRNPNDIRARYVIYDDDTRNVAFRRIDFDVEAYRADLMNSGLQVTPYFLKVVDHNQEALAAAGVAGHALVADMRSPVKPLKFNRTPRTLVVSSLGTPTGRPKPSVTPPAEKRNSAAIAAMVAVLIFCAAVTVLWLVSREKPSPETPLLADAGSEERILMPGDEPPSAERRAKSQESPKEKGKADPDSAAENPSQGEEGKAAANAKAAGSKANEKAKGKGKAAPADTAMAAVPKPKPLPPPDPKPPPKPEPNPEPVVIPEPGEGLVFYAPLDESSESRVAQDSSDGGRHLVIAGKFPGEEGQVNGACGIDRKTFTSNKKPHTQFKEVTISFWIRMREKDQQVEKENAANLISMSGVFALKLDYYLLDANMDLVRTGARTGLPQDNEWHHVLVDNVAKKTRIFIDGVPKASAAETLKAVGNTPVNVIIGSKFSHFALDDIAIWNRKLSDPERKALFGRGGKGLPAVPPPEFVAHWNLDEESGDRVFEDTGSGQHPLGSFEKWASVNLIAPDPIPLTLKKNAAAAKIQLLGERPKNAGAFELSRESGFTYEGWVNPGARKTATLGSTMKNEDFTGWKVALARDKGTTGFAAFRYGEGESLVQALGSELEIYDNQAHHFAAVWDPDTAKDSGTMTLYIDRKKVATAELPHSSIVAGASSPFQIGAPRIGNNIEEFTVDELRFTAAPLTPRSFLNTVVKPPDPPAGAAKAKGK